jgi:hypothetical protein
MESNKKFNSNAISEDSPSFFKNSFVDVIKTPNHVMGKKIFQVSGMKNILNPKPEQKTSQSVIRIQKILDQDLDSLKLSLQPDITKGYKNTLRFQSNHYQSFFDKVESAGFNRLTTEITSLHEQPKIVRTLKSDSTPRSKYKSQSLDQPIRVQSTKKSEQSYFIEPSKEIPRKGPQKVLKNPPDDLEEFEKRLKEFSYEKCKNVQELYHTRKKFSV